MLRHDEVVTGDGVADPPLRRPSRLLGAVHVLDDVGPIRTGRRRPPVGWWLAPAALVVMPFVVVPVVVTVWTALTSDPDVGELGPAFQRTIAWAVVLPLVVTLLGLGLGLLLRRLVPSVARSVVYLFVAPFAAPLVVNGVAFRILFQPDPDRGLATRVLGFLPGDEGWLGAGQISDSLMLAFVWAWVGLVAVVFRVALDDLLEKKEEPLREGLGWLVTVVFLLVAVMAGRTLDLVLTMTPGSTLGDASTFSVLHWQKSGDVTGEGAATIGALWLTVVLALVVVCVVVIRRAGWSVPEWGKVTKGGGGQAAGVKGAEGRADAGRAQDGRFLEWVRPVVLVLLALAWLLPLAALLATSWQDRAEAASRAWWAGPSSLGFGSWDPDDLTYGGAVAPTLATAVVACVLVLVLAAFVARAMEDMTSLGEVVMLGLALGLALVPPQVVGARVTEVFAWGPLTAVPSWPRVLLVHVALLVPLAVVILYGAGSDWLVTIRNHIVDGVKTSGQGDVGAKVQVVVVALWRATWGDRSTSGDRAARDRQHGEDQLDDDRSRGPDRAVVGVLVLVFILVWNDFVVGLTVGGRDAIPLTVYLFGQTRQFVYNSGPLAAGSVVAAVVPLLVLTVAARTCLPREENQGANDAGDGNKDDDVALQAQSKEAN